MFNLRILFIRKEVLYYEGEKVFPPDQRGKLLDLFILKSSLCERPFLFTSLTEGAFSSALFTLLRCSSALLL